MQPGNEDSFISRLTPDQLLGRQLNDIEKKYAPKELYVKGILPIPLPRPRVSIVGSRKASPNGLAAARLITKALVKGGHVVIVSGLAEGIDTSAHEEAISSGGMTIAVLGTPLDKVYPAKNFLLQQRIMNGHLAISQFPAGHPITKTNFVIRNRTMALISDATVIVEAGETSGSLHQGWETLRLGHSLFIWKDMFENKQLVWPQKMMEYGAIPLSDPLEVLEALPSPYDMPVLS